MHKHYIITAHKNPKQLQRLVLKLNDEASTFYVHINASVDIEPFKKVLNYDFVKFISNRASCIWGDFGLVQAVINSLKEVAQHSTVDGVCIWLTGQDYPVKNNQEINSFLSKNVGIDFIDSNSIDKVWPKHWRKRTEYYRFSYSENHGDYVLLPHFFSWSFLKHCHINIYKILLLLRHKISFRKVFSLIAHQRKHPENTKPYGGAGWWTITNRTATLVLDFIDKNQEFVTYHQYTHAPDEMFFQTIIQHLKENDEKINIKPSLTFVKWGKENTTSPITFTKTDYSTIKSIEFNKLFARKFDIDLDAEILDLIDENFLEKKPEQCLHI